MNEFYIRLWQSVFKSVAVSALTLGIWACCYYVIPIDVPNTSAVFNHFVEGVLIFSAIFVTYVLIFHVYGELMLAIRRTPVVVVTDNQLQVYDFTARRYFIFDWKDVEKIEKFHFKGSLYYDIYVRDNERYQFLETNPLRRFEINLNALSLQGAAARIPVSLLNVKPQHLYNELQSRISK